LDVSTNLFRKAVMALIMKQLDAIYQKIFVLADGDGWSPTLPAVLLLAGMVEIGAQESDDNLFS
jgi:hypothetical protein